MMMKSWFGEDKEEQKEKRRKSEEQSRTANKTFAESKDRLLRSLDELEELVKDDRLRRGSNS